MNCLINFTGGKTMKKIAVFLVVVLLFSSLLFAGGAAEQESTKKSLRVATQVPGLITMGIWDGQAFALNSSIYEYLIEIDANTGELVPVLATDWETEDGKTWVFNLREGVTFHDGSAFTAEDVKYTIERTQDPEIGHLKKNDFAAVEQVEIIDDYTIALHLEKALPTFIYLFTDYNMGILSSEYDYASKGEMYPMGTGPFILKEIIPKESAYLVKNESYWDPELPKVDELLLYFVGDIDASVSMLESGEVDVVPQISPIIKKRLDQQEGITVVSPYQENRFIALVQDREPFNDNRVRLAFKYAMDPQVIARSVAQMELNEGVFYNESFILNEQAEYLDIPFRGRDIEKAKELLSEAGYPDGLSVDLYYASDHPYGKELSQTIKELSADAGFELNLKGFTRDVYLSQHWLNVPMSITGWGARVDVSMLLSYAYHSEGPWNESHMNNPKVDELIDLIKAEVDYDTRLGYYHELQRIFFEEGTVINVQVPYLVALSDKVVDYRQPLTMLPQYKYTDIK